MVYSATWKNHIQLLQNFFVRLQDAQLTISLPKSKLCQTCVVILGHVVGQGEVAPVAVKCELMRFIGMAAYYRKICYKFSVVLEPLTSLLQKREKLTCSEECQQAFEKIKSLLLSAPMLKAPDFEKPFKL